MTPPPGPRPEARTAFWQVAIPASMLVLVFLAVLLIRGCLTPG